ncbi:hypothetical protein PG997_006245 [Apiospora hydei]|uniref:Uncharacterized protein n=1 Tax=Apiospora hydei TaxID=1337664 RepID=A0ABR1WN88_9PEZI
MEARRRATHGPRVGLSSLCLGHWQTDPLGSQFFRAYPAVDVDVDVDVDINGADGLPTSSAYLPTDVYHDGMRSDSIKRTTMDGIKVFWGEQGPSL